MGLSSVLVQIDFAMGKGCLAMFASAEVVR
jgi:hypothetical protein